MSVRTADGSRRVAVARDVAAKVRRVAVTRDEPADGPLSTALRAEGLDARPCPVLSEAPAPAGPLARVAEALPRFDWLVCASARAVRALREARAEPWPDGLRTAAVGAATARALVEAGAASATMVVGTGGAEALWARLRGQGPWTGRRVLVPTTPGGRPFLADALRAAGAEVQIVDAYHMAARPAPDIAADWAAAAPHAAVLASPRAVAALAAAIGAAALRAVHVVAIGPTTAAALAALGVPHAVSAAADLRAAARAAAAGGEAHRA
jgi:uroporphyrinogen-III synthase